MSYKGNLGNKDDLRKITPEDSLSVGVDYVSSLSRAYSPKDSIDLPFSGRHNEEDEPSVTESID